MLSPLPSRRHGRKTSASELESDIASPRSGSVKRTRHQTKSPPTTRMPSGLLSGEHASRELHGGASGPIMEDVSTIPVAKAKPLLRLRKATGVNVCASSASEIAVAVGTVPISEGREASSASAAVPSRATSVAPGSSTASSASAAAAAPGLRRSGRVAARDGGDQNVEGAEAADARAVVAARRGIGNMSVAERMRMRSQARQALDSAELRGRGRGRGKR